MNNYQKIILNSIQGINRELPLDSVKGILVVVMAIYHIMNYFSNATPEDYACIRFVSGSFIFISGYIIAVFYEKRYQHDRPGISKRLLIRGIKLLLIFTALNVAINLTGVGNPNKTLIGIEQYVSNLTDIYVLGSPRAAAFQILLPISYLLMIAPVCLFFSKYKIAITASVTVLAIQVMLFDISTVNIELGIVGLIGFCAGIVNNNLKSTFFFKNRLILLFLLILTILMTKYFNLNVLTYSIGIMIIIKIFYDLSKTFDLKNPINQMLILFGQYTLICYIMQIIFLQGLFRILSNQRWSLGYQTISIFLVTNIFLLGLCLSLSFFRDRYKLINKLYKLVFL